MRLATLTPMAIAAASNGLPYETALFAKAGGTGEFFSDRRRISADHQDRRRYLSRQGAIIAGAGGPTRFLACAQAAGRRVRNILLLPHYLTEGRAGRHRGTMRPLLQNHESWRHRLQPRAEPSFPDNTGRAGGTLPQPDWLQDGIGDIELMVSIYQKMGDRFRTSAVCQRRRCMPQPTRRSARRSTRRQCSTSSRVRRWTSTMRSPPTTRGRGTVC